MADRHDNRSSEEIRRDIEGTRSDLHETVDALERKLSVGQVFDEVWGRVRGDRSAGAFASSLGDAIRDNPVPVALMGLGVAWLAVDRATGSESNARERFDGHTYRAGTHEPAEGRVGPYGGESARSASSGGSESGSTMDRARSKATDASAVMRQKVSSAAEAAKDKAQEAGDRFRSSGEEGEGWDGGGMRERAGETAARARQGMEHGAQQARRGFWRAVEEQPLALGAVAFGLGLAGGLSAPTTRWEDEHMGRAADTVKHEAGAAAQETAEDAAEVAKAAAQAAKEEGQKTAEDLQDAGSRIAEEATEAGKERARERGMEPESMKKRARRTGSRTRDRATD